MSKPSCFIKLYFIHDACFQNCQSYLPRPPCVFQIAKASKADTFMAQTWQLFRQQISTMPLEKSKNTHFLMIYYFIFKK
jgi:hypothetical protein